MSPPPDRTRLPPEFRKSPPPALADTVTTRNAGPLVVAWKQLLEPGTRCMDRLRYPQKFVLISIIFFLPLAVIAGLHYAEQRDSLEVYRLRLQGLSYVRATAVLLRRLEQHMAVNVAYVSGDTAMGPRLAQLQQEITDEFHRLHALDRQVTRFDLTAELNHLEKSWRARPDVTRLSALKSLRTNQGFLTACTDFIAVQADKSRLQLEDDLAVYRLVTLVTILRRAVTQRITLLWCLGISHTVGGDVPGQGADFTTLPDLIRNILKMIDKNFHKLHDIPGSAFFFEQMKTAAERTEQFVREVQKDPAHVSFATYMATSDANWASYDTTASLLESTLLAKIQTLNHRLVMTVVGIVATLLIVTYLFLSFYASLLRTVSVLGAASRRMTERGNCAHVSTNTRDEMGEVVDAFNQVADRLRIELDQALRETRRATVAEAALRQSEEQLREALDAAESANVAKSRFLANMSHELRTPLNAIIGYSEMIEEEASERNLDDLVPDLDRIMTAARHLLALINDILDISKIEAGKMEVYRENIDIDKLLDEVVSTIEPLAARQQNRLEVEREAALGHIYSDATKIRQALLNLLSNACKFTEKGTVGFQARREARDDDDWLVFAVRDSGIGMTPEEMGRLFEEFTQADASTTRKYGGTGLGLAISRRFCQLLGGDIEVGSEPGRGSTFTMRIPAVEPIAAAPPAATTREKLPPGGVILVIDDDPAALDLLSRFLRKEGFEVLAASSGAEGLRLARERHPNVITLDIIMPDIDGWEVLQTLKSDPELADIPVIILTMLDDQQRGYALGATEFLVKPVDRERLAGIVRRYRIAGPARVLVVEDDADTRALLTRQLTADGWTVDGAENGKVGLERCAYSRPDLILLDLMMPVMDGFEFVDRLRKTETGRTVPVVVLTARDLTADDRRRLGGQVDRILQKAGLDRENLLGEVRGMLRSIQRGAPE